MDTESSPTWEDQLPVEATLEERIERLERIAKSIEAASTLRATVSSLDVSTQRLASTVDRFNRTRLVILALAGIIVALSIAGASVTAYLLLHERSERASLQSNTFSACESRNQQATAIRTFAELEIDRSDEIDLEPDEVEKRVESLTILRDGAQIADCSRFLP